MLFSFCLVFVTEFAVFVSTDTSEEGLDIVLVSREILVEIGVEGKSLSVPEAFRRFEKRIR